MYIFQVSVKIERGDMVQSYVLHDACESAINEFKTRSI